MQVLHFLCDRRIYEVCPSPSARADGRRCSLEARHPQSNPNQRIVSECSKSIFVVFGSRVFGLSTFQRTAHFPFRLSFLDDVSAIAFLPAAHEGDFGFYAPALSVQAERDCSQSSGLELPDEGGNLSAMKEEFSGTTLIIVGRSILRLPWRDGGVREPEFRTPASGRSAKGDECRGDIRPARPGRFYLLSRELDPPLERFQHFVVESRASIFGDDAAGKPVDLRHGSNVAQRSLRRRGPSFVLVRERAMPRESFSAEKFTSNFSAQCRVATRISSWKIHPSR